MKRQHLVLGLIWLMMFVAYFDRINITVAGPAIMKSLGLAPSSFGLILAAFTFGYALMQIPGGYLADRFGSRPLLIFALVFWSIFTGLTGLSTSLFALIIVRVLFGVGEGLENGAQFKLIGDYFPPRQRSAANAVFLTALSLGPALAAPSAAWFIVHTGWQALFFWFTIPGLLVAGLLAVFLPRGKIAAVPDVERPATGGWGRALATNTTWLAFAAYLCFNVAFWGFIGWMPSYLNASRHIALAQLGFVASVPYLWGFAGTVVVGWLGSTLAARHRPALVAVGYVLAGVSLYFAFTAQGVGQCVAGLSCAAFFLYGGFGPFWAIALDLIPANMRGSFTGFVNFGGQIGGFFAPIVVGAIVSATKSFSGGFSFMIAALMLSAISLFWLEITTNRGIRRGRREEPVLRPGLTRWVEGGATGAHVATGQIPFRDGHVLEGFGSRVRRRLYGGSAPHRVAGSADPVSRPIRSRSAGVRRRAARAARCGAGAFHRVAGDDRVHRRWAGRARAAAAAALAARAGLRRLPDRLR